MIRRPPRSTQSRSSAASDVYKRQVLGDKPYSARAHRTLLRSRGVKTVIPEPSNQIRNRLRRGSRGGRPPAFDSEPVSYTHLRAHETRHDLVCRLLLEKKK